ncbi:MAG: zinc-dependent dehydrogenase [bacterium]
MMRAAVYYNNHDIRIEEMQVPEIGRGELLVRVEASGVCGSDVMEWYRIKKAPRVLGHEIAGVITRVGSGVNRFKKGDRVFVSHHVPCNTCKYCLKGHYSVCDTLRSTNFDPGGFSEYLRVPRINVDRGTYVLPDEMSFEEGAFIEPLACVVRAQRVAGLQPGQSVLVMGRGISGLLHIKLARALGAGRIISTDIVDYRLEAARAFGADDVVDAGEDVPSRVREVNGSLGADLVIVCTAATEAIEQSFRCVDRGGTILLFAPTEPGVTVPYPIWELWHDGITITHSYAGGPIDIARAIELIRFKRVNVLDMITHRLALEETPLGFELVAEARDSMKVIIEPQRGL